MFLATVILSILLAVALVGSAAAKLTKNDQVMTNMRAVGVPDNRVPILAGIEVLGALGLVVGLFWAPLGVAAAIGVVLYFVGALGAHLRANDKNLGPAVGYGVLAVIVLVLRIVTA